MKLISLLALALLSDPALQAPTPAPALEYHDAKAIADADEASLSPQQRADLRASQSALLESGTTACATADPDLSALIVVMQLDAHGKVMRTWLQGNSQLAICLRRHAAAQSLAPPPRAPFYTSIELSFSR